MSIKTNQTFLIVLGLLLVIYPCSTVAYIREPKTDIPRPPMDLGSFNSWLYNLTMDLPDNSYIKDGFNITLSNTTCYHTKVSQINSSFSESEFLLNASGLGLTCTGNWSYVQVSWPHLAGEGGLNVTVGNESNVSLGITLTKGPDGLAKYANLSSCDIDIHISNLTFTGSGISTKILNLLKGYIKPEIESQIDNTICQNLTTLVQTNLTNWISELNKKIRPYIPPTPSPTPQNLTNSSLTPGSLKGEINLMTNPWSKALNVLLTRMFGANNGATGQLQINEIIESFTRPKGQLNVKNLQNITQQTFKLIEGVYLDLGLLQLNFSHLNTWKEFMLYQPISPQSVGTKTELRKLDTKALFYANLTSYTNKVPSLNENGLILFYITGNDLIATTILDINEDRAYELVDNLQKGDLKSSPTCLLSIIDSLQLDTLEFNFSINALSINSTKANETLEGQVDKVINNLLSYFLETYQPVLPAVFNGLVAGPVKDKLNTYINDTLLATFGSNDTCQFKDATSPIPAFNVEGFLLSLLGAVFVFFCTLGVLYPFRKRFSYSSYMQLNSGVEGDGIGNEEGRYDSYPLFFNPSISKVLKLSVLFLILFNVALFVAANTSLGATVNLVLTAGEEVIHLPSLFNFTLVNTVQKMWESKVYLLAVLIVIFSGVWPYLKLAIMFGIWILPGKLQSKYRTLKILDALSKWSLIDAYVLIMLMAAFRLHLESDTCSFDLYVDPEWGFYLFLVATIGSLCLSHLMLAKTRKLLKDTNDSFAETVDSDEDDGDTNAVYADPFDPEVPFVPNSIKKETCSRVTRGLIKIGLILVLFFYMTVLISGSVVPSIEFTFGGITGWLLRMLQAPVTHSYSLIGLGMSLGTYSEFRLVLIQILYFILTIVVPLLWALGLVIYLIPFKTRLRSYNSTMQHGIEIAHAWASFDVAIISVLAALIEIRQFVQFVVSDHCKEINEILKRDFDFLLQGDDICFSVTTNTQPGIWLLIAAGVLSLVFSCVMTQMHRLK